jgi:hypothetical protein
VYKADNKGVATGCRYMESLSVKPGQGTSREQKSVYCFKVMVSKAGTI